MKFKIQAGGELDLLTKEELGDALDQHVSDFDSMLSEGIRFGKSSASGISTISGTVTPSYSGGVAQLASIGPEPGYIWKITNITFTGFGANGADLLINGTSFSDVVYSGLANNGTVFPGDCAVLVQPGNDLLLGFKNSVTNAAINFFYKEVPIRDYGKL